MPPTPRVVKPRKSKYTYRPVMAIDKGTVLLEDGQVSDMSDLVTLLKQQPSSIIVSHYFGEILRFLNVQLNDDPLWQFRVTPLERTSYGPQRKRQVVTKDCVVSYLGFKGERHHKGHYHYALSPHTFCLKSVNELRRDVPGETATIQKLMEWAKDVRDFLEANNMALSPTSGGIAAQFLKDKRFYPNDRRKVPKLTNAKAREHLPGNFYRLYRAKEGTSIHKAAYLDQSAAHHVAASELDFPDANTLTRHGRYSTEADLPFARAGSAKFDQFITHYGLFYLAIETPRFFDKDFPLPECGDSNGGYRRGFFFSNEIAYLVSLGVRIRHIIACWTSPDKERGLNKYARWALGQLAGTDDVTKRWLKPTLLSTYGVLAAKPKHLEFGYRQARGGEPKKYPCGSGFIDVLAKRTTKEIEPLMANVIHRGMIEAETRLRSLEFARQMTETGYSVLAIYADSVFVESDKNLPFIYPPWRIQEYLTALRFQSSTHFTSVELSKTPGIPQSYRDRAKLPPRPRGKGKHATRD